VHDLETPSQLDVRLLRVIAAADFRVLEGSYAFGEFSAFPAHLAETAVALVRDGNAWSVLYPAPPDALRTFLLFSFHFRRQLTPDTSGFVGWLASRIKSSVGVGTIVVCGQNSARGGIFDYWGTASSIGRRVVGEIELLRSLHSSGGPTPANPVAEGRRITPV
jgi:hypothetical protein